MLEEQTKHPCLIEVEDAIADTEDRIECQRKYLAGLAQDAPIRKDATYLIQVMSDLLAKQKAHQRTLRNGLGLPDVDTATATPNA